MDGYVNTELGYEGSIRLCDHNSLTTQILQFLISSKGVGDFMATGERAMARARSRLSGIIRWIKVRRLLAAVNRAMLRYVAFISNFMTLTAYDCGNSSKFRFLILICQGRSS